MINRREEWLVKRADQLERRTNEAKDELDQLFKRAFVHANTKGLTSEWYAIKEAIRNVESAYRKLNHELAGTTYELRKLRREKTAVS